MNGVSAGLVDTSWRDWLPEQARVGYFAAAEAGLPVRHVSSADEAAEAVALLVTSASMTGTSLEAVGRTLRPALTTTAGHRPSTVPVTPLSR